MVEVKGRLFYILGLRSTADSEQVFEWNQNTFDWTPFAKVTGLSDYERLLPIPYNLV